VPLLSKAPGALEAVRALLNTRWNPRRGEPDEDTLEVFVEDPGPWKGRVAPEVDVAELRALRDDVRAALTQGADVLEKWLDRYPVSVRFDRAGTVGYRPAGEEAVPALLAVIAEAMATGTWRRLKACPECAWVFYDHSRNATRTWCGMAVAGPNGRSCGAAAKMRAYRARRAGSAN
jgi:predicted RNA-binding Zn ribbon-like protein